MGQFPSDQLGQFPSGRNNPPLAPGLPRACAPSSNNPGWLPSSSPMVILSSRGGPGWPSIPRQPEAITLPRAGPNPLPFYSNFKDLTRRRARFTGSSPSGSSFPLSPRTHGSLRAGPHRHSGRIRHGAPRWSGAGPQPPYHAYHAFHAGHHGDQTLAVAGHHRRETSRRNSTMPENACR